MRIFYISDIHFKDEAIFEKCKRPFCSIDDMEKAIINNWNSIIKDEDIVYVLGDIGNEQFESSIDIFNQLKGHKHLIIGNHDHCFLENIKRRNIFESIKYVDMIYDNGRKVCLCHYPLMDWIDFNKNSFHIYGHIHNKTEKNGTAYKQIKEYYKDKDAFNCGADVIGFIPRTLDELIILKEMNKDEAYIN